MEAFWELYNSLPQQGPGSDESTARAWSRLGAPQGARILDLGCGPGRQSACIERLSGGHVTAVDSHPPFLEAVKRRSKSIDTVCADMRTVALRPASFDVVWSEGALYTIGLSAGLSQCRRFVKPDGHVAFTELSWLTSERPPDLLEFWAREYPDIRDIPGNIARVSETGLTVFDTFTLPVSDWWTNYYTPLEQKCRGHVLEAPTLEEIDLYRRYSDVYGYVFYLCRAPGRDFL